MQRWTDSGVFTQLPVRLNKALFWTLTELYFHNQRSLIHGLEKACPGPDVLRTLKTRAR